MKITEVQEFDNHEGFVIPFILFPKYANQLKDTTLDCVWFEYSDSLDEAIQKATHPPMRKPSKHQTIERFRDLPTRDLPNGKVTFDAVADSANSEESELIWCKAGNGILFGVKNP